jgi:hypothetical protein
MVALVTEYSPALLENMQKHVRRCIPEVKEPDKIMVQWGEDDDNRAKHAIEAAWHVITVNLYSSNGNALEEKLSESHTFFEKVALDAITLKAEKAAVAAVEGIDYCINEAARAGMQLRQSWRRYEKIAERAVKQGLINAGAAALKSMYSAAERFNMAGDRDFKEAYNVLKIVHERNLTKRVP